MHSLNKSRDEEKQREGELTSSAKPYGFFGFRKKTTL